MASDAESIAVTVSEATSACKVCDIDGDRLAVATIMFKATSSKVEMCEVDSNVVES